MWIARNRNGSLYSYDIKPDYDDWGFFYLLPRKEIPDTDIANMFKKLDRTLYPEITFENSPVEL